MLKLYQYFIQTNDYYWIMFLKFINVIFCEVWFCTKMTYLYSTNGQQLHLKKNNQENNGPWFTQYVYEW
jgi:hypothetical protein